MSVFPSFSSKSVSSSLLKNLEIRGMVLSIHSSECSQTLGQIGRLGKFITELLLMFLDIKEDEKVRKYGSIYMKASQRRKPLRDETS